LPVTGGRIRLTGGQQGRASGRPLRAPMAPVATPAKLRCARRPRDLDTPLGYRDATHVLGTVAKLTHSRRRTGALATAQFLPGDGRRNGSRIPPAKQSSACQLGAPSACPTSANRLRRTFGSARVGEPAPADGAAMLRRAWRYGAARLRFLTRPDDT
jgi:hypothetical protein